MMDTSGVGLGPATTRYLAESQTLWLDPRANTTHTPATPVTTTTGPVTLDTGAVTLDTGAVTPATGVTDQAGDLIWTTTTLGYIISNNTAVPANMTPAEDILYTQRLWGKHIGMIVICVFALIGNGLLVFTIARHRHLWTNTNAFIMSLATADFLFGFPTVPLHIMAESADSDHVLGQSLSSICLVAMSLTSFQIVNSVSTMLALTVERYISIVQPLKHRRWTQPHWVRTIIAAIWIYSTVFGALPMMGWNALRYYNPWELTYNDTDAVVPRCSFLVIHTGQYMGVLFLLHILPVCFIIPFLYTHMFLTIQKFIHRNRTSFRHSTCSKGGAEDPSHHGDHQNRHHLSSRRSLRLLVVIIIYFVFSWLPVLVWYIIVTNGFTYTYITMDIIQDIPLPSAYYQVVVNLGFANSAVNPYIYGLGNMKIRRTFLRMFRDGKFFGCPCGKKTDKSHADLLSPFSNSITNSRQETVHTLNTHKMHRIA